MNRVNTIVILLLLACISNVYGQDSTAGRHSFTRYNYWTAKLPLLNFLDFNSPNLQLGIERRLDKHNAVQFIAGISAYSWGSEKPAGSSIVNGYRLKGEYRRYFNVRRHVAFYGATEVFYTSYHHYTSDSFVSAGLGVHYQDKFYLEKKMWGADVKCGFQGTVGKHWVFEFFTGLGFKAKTVTQFGRAAPQDVSVPRRHPVDINFSGLSNQLGAYTTITAPMNLAVGYRFR